MSAERLDAGIDGAQVVWVVGQQAVPLLSEPDSVRAAELRPDRRERFLRGRAALAAAMREAGWGHSIVAPSVCPDCGRRHGGPEIDGSRRYGSISHTELGSLAAIADALVGVDVQDRATDLRIRPAVDLPRGRDDLLQHWTRIEAVLKADGRGLRLDPAVIEFTPRPGAMLATTPGGTSYHVHDLAIRGDVAAALAIARRTGTS